MIANISSNNHNIKRVFKRSKNAIVRSDKGKKHFKQADRLIDVFDSEYPDTFPDFFEHQKDLAATLRDIAKFEQREELKPVRRAKANQRRRERNKLKGPDPFHNKARDNKRLNRVPVDLICPLCNDQKKSPKQFVTYNDKQEMCCRSCFYAIRTLLKG